MSSCAFLSLHGVYMSFFCPSTCSNKKVTVRATPLETFISLVRIPCSTPHGIIESMQRVERIGTSPELHSPSRSSTVLSHRAAVCPPHPNVRIVRSPRSSALTPPVLHTPPLTPPPSPLPWPTDEQSDIIHVTLRPLFLFPTWTAPRDLCLARYTRIDEDGTPPSLFLLLSFSPSLLPSSTKQLDP